MPTSGPDAVSPALSERLAELVRLTQGTREHSAYLIRRAEGLRARLDAVIVAFRVQRGEWEEWAEILARLPNDPEHKVVVCAQCHRARADRHWTKLPDGIEDELRSWSAVLLSHSYCPDCLTEMEAAVHAG